MREKIQDFIHAAVKTVAPSPQQIFSLLDLTSLGDSDTPEVIASLCAKVTIPKQHVAAVCVYPQFVAQVKTALAAQPIHIATVANFPHGVNPIAEVLATITQSIAHGANEIDVVFPYERYLMGDKVGAQDFIKQCRAVCGSDILLKVILETGALTDTRIIADVCQHVILAGADFLKTSTGKIAIGATLEAAAVMLLTIKEMQPQVSRRLGFKAAGGVRTIEQAAQYIELANQIISPAWVTPNTFRIGASQLADVIGERYANS